MQSISIIEPIKIRLKGYKTLFRRALPLEKHEKAILGLINQNNGSYGFIELGTVLGFAVEDNTDLHIRKDVAEIQLFESYLENLKSSHLIEYNSQGIQLTFWGEKAITDDLKYSFYSGNIQIPEFFDIEFTNKVSNFKFKDIGIEVKLTNEQIIKEPWNLAELEVPDINLINQFHINSLKKYDDIIFDSIKLSSDLDLIKTDLEFIECNGSIDVLYKSNYNEQLSKEINKIPNKLKKDYIKLKINYKKIIESEQGFEIEDLIEFISIIDWNDVLYRTNIYWNRNSISLLEKFQVNWNLISSKVPILIIQDVIDNYIDKFDWSELTLRLNIEFILTNVVNYPWDVDALVERINLDDFKNNFFHLVKLPGINLNKFYKQVDKEFISKNFYSLPNITTFVSNNNSIDLLDYVIEFSDAPWNNSLLSTKLSLTEIEQNFSALKHCLNFEILIERIISESYDCNLATFEKIISLTSFTDDRKILNRYSKCNLSLTMLQILDNNNLIYWGDEIASGFELNPHQNWSIEILKRFEQKWRYGEAIKFLGSKISDYKIIEELKFEWDFESISKNCQLVNQEVFFEKFKNHLNHNSLIHVFDKNLFKSNLEYLLYIDQESKIDELPLVISRLFNLEDILEISEKYYDLFFNITSKIDWKKIWLNTSLTFVNEYIEDIFILIENIPSLSFLKTDLTNSIEVKEVFESPDFAWDWNNVTERAIDEDLVDDETLVGFSGYWDWKVLIEKYFDPEDLQIDGRLSEIAALISQAPDEVSEKSWKFITEIYPSHLLFKIISVTEGNDIFKWDWDIISSSNKISLDLNTLHRYKERINWSLLSCNLFLNSFFRNDREIYGTRKEWENHVLSYLSEFAELWDFKELSKLDNITRSESIVNYFRQKWDWDILSSEKSKLLTTKNKDGVLFNERLFQKFERFINFEVISNRKDALLDFEILNKFNDKNWDWKALSSNESLNIEKEILLNELLEKPWDWKILSNNPVIKFTNEDLLLLRDKDLDWNHFSSKEWLANSTIVELSYKDWDWYRISSSSELIFDQNLLRILSSKELVNWDNILSSNNLHCNENTIDIIASYISDSKMLWSTLSRNENLSSINESLLDKYKDFWDWNILIYKIDINCELILSKYKDYINWKALSSAPNFKANISILEEFKYLLDWKYVTLKIALNDQIFQRFKSFIDWKGLSKNSDFTGRIELIRKYSDFIDFIELEKNRTIDHEISLYVKKYLEDNIHKRFIYNLKKQDSNWAGFVYHFTHLTNALDIIRKRQISSRNLAIKNSKFSDASGSVVNRRHDAHNYARFYFRPQTPTQFYNECLGKDFESGTFKNERDNNGNWKKVWKSDFDKALNLDLPKCPIPVFFKFSLDEIINNQYEKCFISNGNLQTNWARIGTVSEMYNLFDFDDVYSTFQSTSDGNWRTYINKSQQEFLVRDQFDFSDINNYEILVRNRSDLFQLKHLLKDYPDVIQKIRIAEYDDDIYLNNNKDIEYNIDGNSVTVSTNYNGNGSRAGYFEMEIERGTYRINSGQVLSKNGNTIRFYPSINIEFETKPCFKVTFKDQVTNKKPWQIIKYCGENNSEKSNINDLPIYPQTIDELCKLDQSFVDIYNTKVRHYILRDHTNLVLNQFDKYFSTQFNEPERAFFRFFLLVHDIGKPRAFQLGNKDDQYTHSIEILNGIWGKVSNSPYDLSKIQFLLNGDIMGEYFQGKKDAESTTQLIVEATKALNTSPSKLFDELIIYYQCDTAAYTADAGGYKFLEHLFSYESGLKVFDEEAGLLRFSDKYREMYNRLKDEILKWQ